MFLSRYLTEPEHITILPAYPNSGNSLTGFSCSQEVSDFLRIRWKVNLESYCLPNFLHEVALVPRHRWIDQLNPSS